MARFRREDAPSLVREARRDASLTQAELAGLTGLSQSTLAQIESGKRAVSAEMLEQTIVPLYHWPAMLPRSVATPRNEALRLCVSLALSFTERMASSRILI